MDGDRLWILRLVLFIHDFQSIFYLKLKPALLLSLLINIVLSVFVWQYNKIGNLDDQLLDAYRTREKQLESNIDSANRVITATRDSLDIAFLLLENEKRDSEKARTQTAHWQKQYANVNFHAFQSDSARYNALRSLYPSIGSR